MSTVLREIFSRLREAGLEGASALAWVSGGVDSVCLLRLLARAAGEGRISRLEVVHVDHSLRPDSALDAAFVRELACELGVPFHLVTLGEPDFPPGMTVQEAAREARRRECDRVRAARGLDLNALAHHADDQAETVLFRLLRGAGPRGAAGMRCWSPPDFRPLLSVTKADLLALAGREGWRFREDPTNSTPKYSRNRVRNELLPLADSIAPGASAALIRYARLAAGDEALLTSLALAEFERLARREPEGYAFPAAGLASIPAALARRVLLAAVSRLGFDPGRYTSSHLETALSLLDPGRGGRVAPLPSPPLFARVGREVWVYDPARFARAGLPHQRRGMVPGEPFEGEALLALLPEGRPAGEISLRPRREGDRLGSRKVKDLLMEAQIPRWRREFALVAEDREGVLALFAPGRAFSLPGACGDTLRVPVGWWLAPSP